MKILFLSVYGLSSGVLVSAGVFAVLVALGMTPGFAGGTGTAAYVKLYETCIILGALCGCISSLFEEVWIVGKYIPQALGTGLLLVEGFFRGCFVGCLALSIAEMLNSIPIFRRRAGLRFGMEWVVFSLAAGKLVGSLFYFLHETTLFNG